MTTKRTGGRILVDNLVAQGCDRIFHVPGESFLAAAQAELSLARPSADNAFKAAPASRSIAAILTELSERQP